MDIEYGKITTEKIAKNLWSARVEITKPIKCEVTAGGKSEDQAISKLKKLLEDQ